MNLKIIVIFILCGSFSVILSNADRKYCDFSDPEFRKPDDICFAPEGAEAINVDDFLVGVIENFKQDMKFGLPELKIPVLDPFETTKPIRVDVEDTKASVHANFTNLKIEGLSEFILDGLRVDLTNLTLKFRFRIPKMMATGNYSLNGRLIKILPLKGHGGFWVVSHNLSLGAKALMEPAEKDRLQLSSDLAVHIDFDKVEMDFENFMGGGKWTEVLKKMLNDMSKDLFIKFLPLLKGEMNKALRKVINKQLMKFPIKAIIPRSSADEYIDQILHNVRDYIGEKNLDPMVLPEFVSNFSKEVLKIKFHGEAKLYDGLLYGISTIHRTNNCSLNSTKDMIAISAHLGLRDLRVSYKGHAKFMSWGPQITCGGHLNEVDFFFSIEQSNRRGAKPKLKEFQILNMSTLWIDLSGLGRLSWIMKYVLTGVTKLVEDFFVKKVTCTLKQYMEKEFEKISFPV